MWVQTVVTINDVYTLEYFIVLEIDLCEKLLLRHLLETQLLTKISSTLSSCLQYTQFFLINYAKCLVQLVILRIVFYSK